MTTQAARGGRYGDRAWAASPAWSSPARPCSIRAASRRTGRRRSGSTGSSTSRCGRPRSPASTSSSRAQCRASRGAARDELPGRVRPARVVIASSTRLLISGSLSVVQSTRALRPIRLARTCLSIPSRFYISARSTSKVRIDRVATTTAGMRGRDERVGILGSRPM